jgi:membrane protein implicated in regulation of membrane protease activity
MRLLSLSTFFLATTMVLFIAEIMTGTFYLSALGFAALITAVVTWIYEPSLWGATVVFALASAVTVGIARRVRQRFQGERADPLADMDRGGSVTIVESDEGHLRVSYRDSTWEAIWEGRGSPRVGQKAEIVARDGSRLRIRSADLQLHQQQG